MKSGALILAAGATNRTSMQNPTQMIGSISVVQRLIMTFHLAGVDQIVVLISEEDNAKEKLEKYAGRNGVELMLVPNASRDLFVNACIGLRYLEKSCDNILVTPVGIPLFSVSTVKKLLCSKKPVISPSYEGRAGHPLMIAKSVIPDILKYVGEEGMRGAVKECGTPRSFLTVDDPGVYVYSDQFEECEKIAVMNSRDQWRPVTKLQIAKESAFLGPGSWQLLSLIEASGSVRLACEQMGISYSKAWKILNNLETQVGIRILVRRHGGKNGGDTSLTSEGRRLMEQYEDFERECSLAVGKIFEKHFGAGNFKGN